MIVLAILAILAGVIIFAIKPGNIFDEFNDQRRVSDISNISKAIDYLSSMTAYQTLSFGVATNVYISLPDNTSTTCSSYALPTLPTGYAYQCQNATNYRLNDSTGWIPINFRESDNSNILATLPIDPTNDVNYYYSYNPGGSYEVNAFFKSIKYMNAFGLTDGGDSTAYEKGSNKLDMPLTFPHNWIRIPGNTTYQTTDFWVMQYEAKYSTDGKTGSDANTECKYDVLYDTWDYNKSSGGCTIPWTYKNIISSPLGSPIAGITHDEAKAACAAQGAHLITNQEWMTISRNVAIQSVNWTSNPQVVGTGYLFNGNSADTSRGYDGPNPDKGINRNQRAILTLSNGSRIYDFSGNVWEHVMKDISDTLLDSPQPNTLANDGVYKGSQFTSLTGYGNLSYDEIRPIDQTWDTGKGVGLIYHYDGAAPASRVLRRGGRWDYGSFAGAFALTLDWSTGSQNNNIGFRCAR